MSDFGGDPNDCAPWSATDGQSPWTPIYDEYAIGVNDLRARCKFMHRSVNLKAPELHRILFFYQYLGNKFRAADRSIHLW
jgi:hypothetical protein